MHNKKDTNWILKAEELYKEGLPYYKIGEILGINRKTVSYNLRKLGYKSNPKYVRNVDPKKLRKSDYKYADTLFEKINSEEKAYWLGFLYADGNVSESKNTISLALAEKDLNHLKKFKDFFKLDNKKITKKIKRMNGKKFISYEFAVNSNKIKQDLIKLGCTPNKTFSIKFPNSRQVPKKYLSHFVRGYFDGDGCVTFGGTSRISVELLGTEDFLIGYQQWTGLHQNKIHSFKTTNIKHSMYGGIYAIKILNKIYKNANIYLERKHNKFLELCRLWYNTAKRPRVL